LAAGGLMWSRLKPVSFGRASGCLRGWWWRRAIRRDWAIICRRCGLAEAGVPAVRRSRVSFPHVELRVRPTLGQTTQDFESAAEAVRMAVGEARPPAAADLLDAVPMGRREDGSEWLLALGPHTLVAGTSGSGKGSVFWSFAFGLAPRSAPGTFSCTGST
jgi:DNA segregation ATPase FtsK/SpoIIIE, S-DNA-T family